MSGSTISNTVTVGITLGYATSGGTYASPLTITAAGAVTASSGDALYGNIFAAVYNYGTIAATGTAGDGIDLRGGAGGTLSNTGLITGYSGGVYFAGSPTLTNSGTIVGTGSSGFGISLSLGGSLGNTGLIAGYRGVLSGGAVTVANSGTIAGTGSRGVGVYLAFGGSVANTGTGLIEGYIAVHSVGGATVANAGTIVGTGGAEFSDGVYLQFGGSVGNTGLIAGDFEGIRISAGTGAVANSGTIAGTGNRGVDLTSGGSVDNTGTGLIEGGAFGGAIGIDGIAGTIANAGTINGIYSYGVRLYLGGSITNTGLIEGRPAVDLGALGAVVNSGTIAGTNGYGIVLQSGGSISNTGTGLIAGDTGIKILGAPGAISNSGTILGTGASGVYLGAGGTFTDSGTVGGASGTAISFGGTGSNLLILANGYELSGGVAGSGSAGASNTLELAGSVTAPATVNYNGLLLTNFSDVLFGPGGNDTLAIGSTAGTLPVTISGFTLTSDAIDLTAIGANGTITGQSGTQVTIAGSSGTVTLNLDATDGTNFHTAPDGASGTALVFGSTISNTVTHGIVLGTAISGGTYASPLTIASTGEVTLSGTGDAIYGPGTRVWTVVNQGSVVVAGSVGDGIDLKLGGSVDNSGLIEAPTGVYAAGAAGRVTNSGTVAGAGTSGVGVALIAGGTIIDSRTISGASGTAISFGGTGANLLLLEHGYKLIGGVQGSGSVGATNTLELAGSAGAAVTVNYQGLSLTNFSDVLFGSGGNDTLRVSNTSGTPGVTISGFTLTSDGIDLTAIGTNGTITGQSGTQVTIVGSSGTVTLKLDATDGARFHAASDGASGTDLLIFVGSIISNTVTHGIVLGTVTSGGTYTSPLTIASTGAVALSGTGYAIYGASTQAWTVLNQGSIVVAGTTGDGVDLKLGGSIDNSGLIEAPTGLYITGAPGTVANYGTIAGTGAGVFLEAGGSVGNTGLIEGFQGIAIGAPGTVTNSGTIEGRPVPYAGGVGISLQTGGSVANLGSAALISGNYGVVIYNAAGRVTNSGTIIGSVRANAGGSVDNAASGLIEGYGGVLFLQLNSGTVTNSGTITGTGTIFAGVEFGFGGSVINAPGGLIRGGGGGVVGFDGTVVNYGTIASTGTSTSRLFGGAGVVIFEGGGVTNAAGGLIQGSHYGVYVGAAGTGAAAFVVNYGTIIATGSDGSAVNFRSGSFVNHGLAEGAASGIQLGGTIGTIGSTGTPGSGEVTVFGTVVGRTGISTAPAVTAGYTVSVGGTIIGNAGIPVSLTPSAANRLIVAPGAAFTGAIDGGGGASVLEIAATAGTAVALAGKVGAAGAAAYVALGSVTNFSVLATDPSVTFGGVGVLDFATLVNQGQVNVGAGDTLGLGVVVSASNTGTIDLVSTGTVAFHGAVAAQQQLYFQPPGGTALIDHPEAFLATVAGFVANLDTIDLTGLLGGTVGNGGTLDGSGRLVVNNGSQSAVLQLDTSGATGYTGVTWQASTDGGLGTDVVPVCFCRGTLILTDRGEVAVEALAVGDRVVTLSGAAKAIRWIGMGRDLVTHRHSLARPIVVRAGALADDVPRRDLYLTHGHALHFDGVLIPVENLVNHRSIRWDEAARVVEYYHIELDDHDVVLAEGAPAESYCDADNRALFQNTRAGSEPAAATPTCAPVLNSGETVERIWARLLERAGGCSDTATTDDPDLHLVVAGKRLDPVSVADGLYTFALDAPPVGPLRLCSRSAVPSLTGLDRRDHRRLGVALRQIILAQPGVMTAFDHDSPALAAGGCHPPEAAHSWTDGELALPAELFAHLRGPVTLLVHTRKQAMRYPVPAVVATAQAA